MKCKYYMTRSICRTRNGINRSYGVRCQKITMKYNINELKRKQKSGKKIAIFCAGQYGMIVFEILKICGLDVDNFFDNNSSKWSLHIENNIYCVNPNAIENKDDYFIIICIRAAYYEKVRKEVSGMGFCNIIDYGNLLDSIVLNDRLHYFNLFKYCCKMPEIDLFYQPSINDYSYTDKKSGNCTFDRIAVYTGIFDAYDNIASASIVLSNVDYYLISDYKPSTESIFEWIDAKNIIPSAIVSPIKRNRYIKMHPHILFPDYKYSVYIDGNVSIKKDITSFIKKSNTGIATFLHPKRDCIFYEALAAVSFRRVIAEDVYRQMDQYLKEGMPLHYGLTHMALIAREHHNPVCVKIMEAWWNEFSKGVLRDQLSFMYVLWKNGMSLKDISLLGKDIYEIDEVKINKHCYESKYIR